MQRNATIAILVPVCLAGLVLAIVACQPGREAAGPASEAPRSAQPTAPAVAAPAAPASPHADATITNAPALAGTVVVDLPAPPAGATRAVVDGDGAFTIAADGKLVRGFTAIPAAGTRQVTVRQTAADGSSHDQHYLIAVGQAPWSLDAFPEMIVQSLTQEGVSGSGPLAEVAFGGLAALTSRNATANASAGHEPDRPAGGRGIAFPAGGTRQLTFKPEGQALILDRWALAIFRVEAGGRVATLVSINDGPQANGRSGNWFPRLQVDAAGRAVVATYRGSAVHQLRSADGSVATDGRWNVALTWRRHGSLFLRVNGADCGQPSPTAGFSTEQPDDMTVSRIGDTATDTPAWALDGLWIGQSELSDRVAAKMEAWALQRAAALPGGAAAAPAFHPVIDDEDFPHRYTFDPARYQAWKEANPKEKRLAFQGRSAAEVQPDHSDWVRVFLDDFRKPASPGARALNGSSVGDSTADVDTGRQIWYAPGTNSAVGGKALCKDGNDRPFAQAYVPDFAAGTLAMRLYATKPGKDGLRWFNGQFTSVDAAGTGYAWAGPKGFRIRAKLTNPGPGLFPCPLWFYSTEHLFWRTGERIEFDIIELDREWDNYGATHVHNGAFKGLFGHSAVDTMKKSTVPEELRSLKLAAGKRVCGVDAWDGAFHTWEVWIHDDLTYINVDGLEVARVTTAREYLERLYMYIDTSLKDEKGLDPAVSHDLVLDSVEAFMPAAVVEAVPESPFTARPALSGTAAVGGVVTCTANLAGCDDVWYYWHVDGYARGFGRSPSYTVLPDDRGASIRCQVVAVGAKDQPEAWTAALPVP